VLANFSAMQERGLVIPDRTDRQVTGVRALSHATTLMPIEVGNERLRPVDVKCDGNATPEVIETQACGTGLGLDNAKHRCSVSTRFNLVSDN
jgi:hypothetical protein